MDIAPSVLLVWSGPVRMKEVKALRRREVVQGRNIETQDTSGSATAKVTGALPL
jgi:hypothetical protein